jgi:hypothetical protein
VSATPSAPAAVRAQAVFFDIGGTLGAPTLSPDLRLERLDVYPDVPAILDDLRAAAVPLGVISNIGDATPENVAAATAALERAGIGGFFRDDLRIYGPKDDVPIFQRAAAAASLAPGLAVFVGEDARERAVAARAGLRVAPHPRLARAVLEGDPLHYVRITIPASVAESPWRAALLQQALVPLHVTGDRDSVVYAIASRPALAALFNMRLIVQTLGDEGLPATTDLYLLRDDLAARSGRLTTEGQAASLLADDRRARRVLSSSLEGLHVALPGEESIDDYHFDVSRHGHHLRLSADTGLLRPFGTDPRTRVAATAMALSAERDLRDTEVSSLAHVTTELISSYLDRYAGMTPLGSDDGGAIRTRHSASADNARVVQQIARDLARIGGGAFTVRVHPFTLSGRELFNVEAEWPGTSPDVVVVSAHLDSTAAGSHITPGAPPYHPAVDPAPGADDDGSGVAAVLAIAETLTRLAGAEPPRRGLRFVLFNAEEQGLVGSRAWVRDQAAAGTPIAAAFQMDMIGNNVVPPPLFEVHAGYSPSADVEERSLALARRIQRVQPIVAPRLTAPEIAFTKGPWPEHRDGAEGRSDHSSFHAHGYAACCVSEDLFANEPGLPDAEVNANYHKATDTVVNRSYAADIARVVAAAAWLTANP